MLGQSKNPFQAEIDSACEIIDFWRFNVHYGQVVPRADLDALVTAACIAPAPHHSRPWRWVVLDGEPARLGVRHRGRQQQRADQPGAHVSAPRAR